ncbi:lysosome-associated membrane glycoprotein 2 isoform X2 [Mugil cephalus]|uniref:lysosome-associated membrane glycoprotein 2 isoform X2 n=1 Tax=Mugil cephalus TaxID=48193 RepID=UPI001FB83536|nr:lysosome-associated membrane glycoprotein 2 isoform X2 [Mugil cephalus]
MSRYAAFVSVLAFGLVFTLSRGTEVSFKQDDKLCIYANIMLNFSVNYEGTNKTTQTAAFELPANVSTAGSKCGDTNSTLKLNFGDHFWMVVFSLNGSKYQADSITFSYNLSDATLFPHSVSNETANVTIKPQIKSVGVDTCYSCKSIEEIRTESVNMTLWNVLVQAFVVNGSKSENITSCSADIPSTTAAPITNTTTTASPPPPTTTPTPTLPTPTTGNYSIKQDENSTACLLADFGLRIGFGLGEKYQEINLDPTKTNVSGSCGDNSSELVLVSNSMTIHLSFASDTKKFRLHALNVTVNSSNVGSNANLSLWEASVGSSYMCNKEQNYNISDQLIIYTFNLRVQPFKITKGVFSTAEECQAGAESFLVPIAVGVALLVLILVVLVAYFIGRKRNMASSYESL